MSDQEAVVYLSIVDSYTDDSDAELPVAWSEGKEFITDKVRKCLNKEIPEFRNDPDGSWFVYSIEKVEFPTEELAYVEILSGDPFFMIRYVNVFERSDTWQRIDQFQIGSGLIDSLSIELNWDIYFEKLQKKRSSKIEDTLQLLTDGGFIASRGVDSMGLFLKPDGTYIELDFLSKTQVCIKGDPGPIAVSSLGIIDRGHWQYTDEMLILFSELEGHEDRTFWVDISSESIILILDEDGAICYAKELDKED